MDVQNEAGEEQLQAKLLISKYEARRRKLIEEEEKAKMEGLISSEESDGQEAGTYIPARQRKKEQV